MSQKAVAGSVQKGFVAVDIGAHHGSYTFVLSKLVGAHDCVIAVEPIPPNFRLLGENIGLNHCAKVEALSKADSNKEPRVWCWMVRGRTDSHRLILLIEVHARISIQAKYSAC